MNTKIRTSDVPIENTNPTAVKIITHSLQNYYQHDITIACFNDAEVRRNCDTKVTGLNGTGTRSTEVFNVDPDNFEYPHCV